jgi:hypothetical protein
MTTPSRHQDPAAPAGLSLQSDEAKAMVAEIKADNAEFEEAFEVAEAQAEVVTQQAQQLAEATEEVLEELQEARSAAR